jgi:predicted enzyme related to lactoylglutathione lyase
MVNDQEKALEFYTKILGFVKKTEVPLGEHKWLTVVSKDELNGVELLLEPLGFPPAKVYQAALYKAGIPLTAFAVTDINAEYNRMKSLGVKFSTIPKKVGPVMIAVFDDTCGNNIQLVQLD